MDCPKCGKPMEHGYLIGTSASVPIFWLPEAHKYPFFLYTDNAVLKRNGIIFETELLKRTRLETYVCRACGVGNFTFETQEA